MNIHRVIFSANNRWAVTHGINVSDLVAGYNTCIHKLIFRLSSDTKKKYQNWQLILICMTFKICLQLID